MPLRARKRFGQHWLRSDRILDNIIAAADLSSSDRVLEIGPGTGALTRRLLSVAGRVVAVELDWDVHRRLAKALQAPQLHLLQADFLDLDLAATLGPDIPLPNKVVANIPYNITGPILLKLLGTISQPAATNYDSIVLLVQKEVADRLCAQPSTKAFGALTVRCRLMAECEVICPVPPKAFVPPPKVESAVIRLQPRPYPMPVSDPKRLETLIRLGFASKRKMLRNNLKSLADSDRLTEILTKLQLNPQARAEDLGVRDWIALSDRLAPAHPNPELPLGPSCKTTP